MTTINEIASESASSALLASQTSLEFKCMAEQMQGLVNQILNSEETKTQEDHKVTTTDTIVDIGEVELF